MLEELTETQWTDFIEVYPEAGLFDSHEFLGIASLVYHLQPRYYIYKKKESILLGFAVLTRKKSIVIPNHFYYSSILFKEAQSGLARTNALTEALTQLKKRYNNIQFRLSPGFQDIRPFIWNGFYSRMNYTYVHQLNSFDYRDSVKTTISNAEKQGVTYAYDRNYAEAIKLTVHDFRQFQINPLKQKKHIRFFETLIAKGLLKSFSAYLNNQFIATALLLIDNRRKAAYNLHVSSGNQHYKVGVHSGLYNYFLRFFSEKGYREVDLFGANMKSIADFKAKFGGELKAHYDVEYIRMSFRPQAIYLQLKELLLKGIKFLFYWIGATTSSDKFSPFHS